MTLYLLAILIGAFIWAKLEVEIEGKDGWAKNLPTWRIEKHVLLDLFLNGRAMTGYHLWAFSFIFFAFHLPVIAVQHWSLAGEARALGGMLVFWVVEDFIWFMVNPHFGWQRYRRQDIEWHHRWFCGIPADHWPLLFVGGALLAYAAAHS